MGSLTHLRKSILDMDDEALMDKIRQIRVDRKINRNPVKEKTAKKEKGKLTDTLKVMLAKMTPAQAEAFLKELSE